MPRLSKIYLCAAIRRSLVAPLNLFPPVAIGIWCILNAFVFRIYSLTPTDKKTNADHEAAPQQDNGTELQGGNRFVGRRRTVGNELRVLKFIFHRPSKLHAALPAVEPVCVVMRTPTSVPAGTLTVWIKSLALVVVPISVTAKAEAAPLVITVIVFVLDAPGPALRTT